MRGLRRGGGCMLGKGEWAVRRGGPQIILPKIFPKNFLRQKYFQKNIFTKKILKEIFVKKNIFCKKVFANKTSEKNISTKIFLHFFAKKFSKNIHSPKIFLKKWG